MSLELSKRIQRLKTSPVRKLVPYGEEATKKGIKIHHLNIGQPDIDTPRVFFDAISKYEGKVLKYEHSAGIMPLREKMKSYYDRLGLNYSIEDILVVNGGSEALQFIFTALFDEGDEVLIGEPYYANYNSFFDVLNIKRNAIRTYAEDGYHFRSLEDMESMITPNTKAFMFSNPSNPTGVVCTKEELDNIAYLAKKYDLYIISDEVYREFVYGENKAISFGTYKELEDRVIIIDSISKRYSACGARIGCVVSKNKEFMSAIFRQCQARLSVPTLEMVGAAALYDLPDNYLESARLEYKNRKNILFAELSSMEGVVTREPEGAFYSFVKLPILDGEDFAIWLLSNFNINNETVMFAPGEGFYATEGLGKNEVRICYAIESEDLKRAMTILRLGLKEYKRLKGI